DRIENFLNNREDVYLGSTRHFFYALMQNRLKQEGFKLYRVTAGPGPAWPNRLSEALSKGYLQSVEANEIKNHSSRKDFSVFSDDLLEIIYTGKEWKSSPYQDFPYQVSRIKINENLSVTAQGYVFNACSFVAYGFLAEERMAKMLPYEYGKEGLGQ
ncbi:MAG: hypothetical protein KFF73_20245, partial [Cyclobacteriaceae bacterium]|nr:hypothetical protein [Cyclobacteriaceae bacterium]